MDRNSALILLGIEADAQLDSETIEYALANAIFTETRYFMLRDFIPKLANARIKRLQLLSEAAVGLNFEEQNLHVDYVDVIMDGKDTFLDILETYHQAESKIKLNLSNAETTQAGALSYSNWIEIFYEFSTSFIKLFEKLFPYIEVDDSVKISTIIDYSELKESLVLDSDNQLIIKFYSKLKKTID